MDEAKLVPPQLLAQPIPIKTTAIAAIEQAGR
jgi:hypothetical protein